MVGKAFIEKYVDQGQMYLCGDGGGWWVRPLKKCRPRPNVFVWRRRWMVGKAFKEKYVYQPVKKCTMSQILIKRNNHF